MKEIDLRYTATLTELDDVAKNEVARRLARQNTLTRQPQPPTVWSVLDESVLYRTAGSPATMREQLLHLSQLTALPTVTIQILPMERGPQAGINGTFIMFAFPDLTGNPTVAYTDDMIAGAYYERPDQVRMYRNALTRAPAWRKSSYSKAQNDYIETTTNVPGRVGVRDSKLGTDSPMLAVTLPQWRATLLAAQTSEFN